MTAEEFADALAWWEHSTNICAYCGRRFLPTRTDQKYCKRPAPADARGRTCAIVAPGVVFLARHGDRRRRMKRDNQRRYRERREARQ